MKTNLISGLCALVMITIVLVTSCKKDEPVKPEPPITKETYEVTFNANGGEGSMTAQEIEEEKETALTANAFTRADYTFSGWNTKADGSGTSYDDKAKVTLTADMTLYAQWVGYMVTIEQEDFTLEVASIKQLSATVHPADLGTVVWSSDDDDIATVEQDGMVIAQGRGTTTIHATVGDVSDEVQVTVTVPKATEIAFEEGADFTLQAGVSKTLAVEPTPSTASLEGLKWSSSDEAIATVVDGVVTGVAEGEATITATLGALTTSVKVTVIPASEEWMMADFSATNYPEGDTWQIHDEILKRGHHEGLYAALKDVNSKKSDIVITLEFVNAIRAEYRFLPYEDLLSIELRILAPNATIMNDGWLEYPNVTYLSCPKLTDVTTDAFPLNNICQYFQNIKAENIILNPEFFFVDTTNGTILSADKTILYTYLMSNSATSYTTPNTVNEIKSDAFYGCKLESIEATEVRTVTRMVLESSVKILKLPKVSNVSDVILSINYSITTLELASKVRYSGKFKWTEGIDCSKIILTTNAVNVNGFKMTSSNGEKSEAFKGIFKDESTPISE